MLVKYIFNESIKRIFNIFSNGQIISSHLLKDYISDIKLINDNIKKDKIMENNINCNNSNNLGKYTDSSQNLISINNISTRTGNNLRPITNANNSFYLYLNSSFKSLILDKIEGLIIKCNWKKKYILSLKIVKINDIRKIYKSIDIECIEMNHYENPFKLEISLYWNSTEYQTLVLAKITPRDKIIEEIINREFNNKVKKKIFNNIKEYLLNDLSNIEHCATSLIFGNMKEIALYLSDIKKLILLSIGTENKRLEVYNSSLISSGQNCRVYDNKTNQLCEEFILSGYYVKKNNMCQMRWEKKVNNKIYCIYRLSIIYLEENISLMIFRNVWHQHIPSHIISEIERRKDMMIEDVKNYFIKKNRLIKTENNFYNFYNDINELNLKIGLKNYQKDENNQIDLDIIVHNNNSFIKNTNIKNENREKEKEKEKDNQNDDSLFQNSFNNSNFDNNLFTNTIQNISEIENNPSAFLFEEEDNKILNKNSIIKNQK